MKKSVTLTTLLLIIVSFLMGGIQVYARESWQHGGTTTDRPLQQLVGNNINLTANVEGSKEGLQYKFVWETEGWKNWGIIRNFEDSNKVIWKPTKPGNYTIHSDIRDKYGNEKSKPLNIKVDSSGITIGESSLLVDNDIVLTTKAKGSTEGLKYKFVWETEGWKNWGIIRNFEDSNKVTWKPTKPGDYTIYSDIRDKYGNEKKETLNVKVKNNFKHSGITTDKLSPGWVNSNITLTAKAEGSTKGLKYKFVWQRKNWEKGNWGIIKGFDSHNTATWKPTEPGDYTIYSDIKDKYGNTITEKINFNTRQHGGITTNKPSPQLVGNNIVLTANVKGSKEGLKYKFVWQRENWEKGNWGIIRDFKSENKATWKPTKPGNYTIYSDIKDKNNESVTENTSLKVFLSPQEINYSSDSIPAGKTFYLGVEGATRLSTSDEKIAKITPHNMVYGVSPGTATIKAYNASGKFLLERKVTVGQAQPIKFAYAYFNGSTHGSTFDLIAITDKHRDAVGFIAGGKFIEAKEKVEEGNTYVWIAKNVAAGLENTEVKACSRNKGVWSTCSDGKISLYLNNKDDNIPSLKRRNISEAGIKFIAEWEGFKESVYNDELAGNKPTIGYGKLINPGDTFYNNLTKREAQAMLIYSLNNGSYISSVNNFLIKNSVKFNQNHFDSLVSFSYNLGTSWMDDDKEVRGYIFNAVEKGTTQRNLSCIKHKEGFSYEMLRYHHAGKHECILGLLYRRIDEMNIFFKGDYARHAYKYNKYGYSIPGCIKEKWDKE